MPASRVRGFTLIELMITVAILAILASIAYPSYSSSVMRSRVAPALEALTAIAGKMELVFQDLNGTYGTGPNCNIALGEAPDFVLSCVPSGTGFIATATGTGRMANYAYTIDEQGKRKTTSHPKGSNNSCWTMRGTSCDI